MEKLSIKVYQVGLGHIRMTHDLKVSSTTTMKELYDLIQRVSKLDGIHPYTKVMVAATIKAYDPSKIGYYRYPGRVFVSDNPDGVPKFNLDKSDAKKTITECGITDGAELMYNNGEMD